MELLGLRINHMALCSFVWLYLVIGAVAFNGKEAYPKDPTDEKSDFSCDEKGYLEYLNKWDKEKKGTSRDVPFASPHLLRYSRYPFSSQLKYDFSSVGSFGYASFPLKATAPMTKHNHTNEHRAIWLIRKPSSSIGNKTL